MISRNPAQQRRRQWRNGRRYAARKCVRGGVVLALALGLSACSAPSPTLSNGSENTTSAPHATAAAAPSQATAGAPRVAATGASPAGSAGPAPKAGAVAAALKALVAATPQPSREQIRESLATAGFLPAAMEVSASRTPTGLAADAVEVGVLDAGSCVMAQLRSGTVETSVLPVLPSGRCFAGSVQR